MLARHPSATGDFFLKIGAGVMGYSVTDNTNEITATAPAGSFGLGYDFRIGRTFALTPYLNSLATSAASFQVNGVDVPSSQELTISVVRFGVGLHWY